MEITEEEYAKAQHIVNQYRYQQREKHLAGLELPCPSCGGETSNEGDCRNCGIIYLNSVHQIKWCDKHHTHSNNCFIPFEKYRALAEKV